MKRLALCHVFNPAAPGRLLGDGQRLLGDREGAQESYEAALTATVRIQHRPELALTRVRLAELLLSEGPRTERVYAQELLDLAIPELKAMAMGPFLERARAMRWPRPAPDARCEIADN
jgi:hypothetical protein